VIEAHIAVLICETGREGTVQMYEGCKGINRTQKLLNKLAFMKYVYCRAIWHWFRIGMLWHVLIDCVQSILMSE